MGLIPVANDQLATVVTTLEMTERPRPKPMPEAPFRIQRWEKQEPSKYQSLFRRVGSPWLWFSRLVLDDASLASIIHSPTTHVFAVLDRAGIEVGMLELDFGQPDACGIAYFGLVPELTGRGLGRWLMAQAMARAWVPEVERVRVNTCTLDHPRALGFYRAQGFTAVSRTVETFADPRVAGILPRDAAPHVPLLASTR